MNLKSKGEHQFICVAYELSWMQARPEHENSKKVILRLFCTQHKNSVRDFDLCFRS